MEIGRSGDGRSGRTGASRAGERKAPGRQRRPRAAARAARHRQRRPRAAARLVPPAAFRKQVGEAGRDPARADDVPGAARTGGSEAARGAGIRTRRAQEARKEELRGRGQRIRARVRAGRPGGDGRHRQSRGRRDPGIRARAGRREGRPPSGADRLHLQDHPLRRQDVEAPRHRRARRRRAASGRPRPKLRRHQLPRRHDGRQVLLASAAAPPAPEAGSRRDSGSAARA